MVKRKADIGVVGLGVMGWNLILNMTDHGFMVALYNRTRVLFLDPFFSRMLSTHQASWRRIVCRAAESGIPVPALSAGLSIYDGYRQARSPANLIQAQRDYFGAHEYERVDQPRGKFFHTNWKKKRRANEKSQSRRK